MDPIKWDTVCTCVLIKLVPRTVGEVLLGLTKTMVHVACFVLLKPVFADISNRCLEIAYAVGLVRAVPFEGA